MNIGNAYHVIKKKIVPGWPYGIESTPLRPPFLLNIPEKGEYDQDQESEGEDDFCSPVLMPNLQKV